MEPLDGVVRWFYMVLSLLLTVSVLGLIGCIIYVLLRRERLSRGTVYVVESGFECMQYF